MLEIRGLDSFYGRAQILDSVDLKVGAGEAVALLGRNGAGKSTLLKSIVGLVRERRGSIRFQDTELLGLPTHLVSRLGVGYVPEERRIFTNLTVRENLEVGRRRGKPGRWPLERIFEVFPNLKGMLGRMAGEMSGGEQQMLTVARTLMGDPRLVLLDEPSEGLAPLIVEQMARMVRRLHAEGLSILLCEQNMHFAGAVCERAYIIERGAIRFSGDMRRVVEDEALRRDYLAV
ncbi:MAG TPA: ABC transporter ATP-binding protein [Burkholderiales bacterium]|nr:ABC transporter ATP-binding protein [Burkholderiales bacterium]